MNSKVFTPWAEKINEETNGRVNITIFPGGTMAGPMDTYDLILSGGADIAPIEPGFTRSKFPLSQAIGLPLIFKDATQCSEVYHKLIEKYLLDGELKEVKYLFCNGTPNFDISNNKVQIRTMADMAGLKLATTEPSMIPALEILGAVPVFMPPPEIYTSLERGMVDGTVLSWDALKSFKSFEVTKYRTVVGLYIARMITMMNMDTWNSLPPDIQKIIDENSGLGKSIAAGKVMDAANINSRDNIIVPFDKDKGNPDYVVLSDEERGKWRDALSPLYGKWIEENEGKGLPAQAFFDDMIELTGN
jgi:TRAP-type C4-dicarboxylate transport system substrate-binding protein